MNPPPFAGAVAAVDAAEENAPNPPPFAAGAAAGAGEANALNPVGAAEANALNPPPLAGGAAAAAVPPVPKPVCPKADTGFCPKPVCPKADPVVVVLLEKTEPPLPKTDV